MVREVVDKALDVLEIVIHGCKFSKQAGLDVLPGLRYFCPPGAPLTVSLALEAIECVPPKQSMLTEDYLGLLRSMTISISLSKCLPARLARLPKQR